MVSADLRLPRGLRNRNPGNVRLSDTVWQGQVPGTDPAFCTFDCDENGIRAITKILLSYYRKHGLNTVSAIIHRWAPPSENDTAAYVNSVAQALGVDPELKIEVSDPGTLATLVRAIIRHENGRQPYPPATIAEGVRRALA
jgi:hypothetical protein